MAQIGLDGCRRGGPRNGAYTASASTSSQDVFFFGADPSGNTIIYHWEGHTVGGGSVVNASTVLASAFNGAVELIGVEASTLLNSNFH